MFSFLQFKTLLGSALCLPALALVGCQAQRAVVAPVEPAWSYHDGNTQLSNNDRWDRLIPNTPVFSDGSQVARSVEDATAE